MENCILSPQAFTTVQKFYAYCSIFFQSFKSNHCNVSINLAQHSVKQANHSSWNNIQTFIRHFLMLFALCQTSKLWTILSYRVSEMENRMISVQATKFLGGAADFAQCLVTSTTHNPHPPPPPTTLIANFWLTVN